MSAYSRRKRAGKSPKRAKPDRRTPPASDRQTLVASPPRRAPRILPWEGDHAADYYDRGLARLMREIPGR